MLPKQIEIMTTHLHWIDLSNSPCSPEKIRLETATTTIVQETILTRAGIENVLTWKENHKKRRKVGRSIFCLLANG